MAQAKAQFIEQDCTFEHNGRKFESGGAVVTDQWLIAYPKKHGILGDWHGNAIGTYRILSTWRTPRSFISSTMSSIECFVFGVRYVGRGAGVGMILRAKRSTRQGR
jgi:hypothetical protein